MIHAVDEIRFIDASDLTTDHIGNPEKFRNRQPKAIMPNAECIIVVATYIAKFVTTSGVDYGKMSRLVLAGYYANIVSPLLPIKTLLESAGFEAQVIDGSRDAAALPLKGTAVKAGLGWIGKNSKELVPFMTGYQLPYNAFKKNLQHIIDEQKDL